MHFFSVSIACYSALNAKGSFNTISYVARNIIVKMFKNRSFSFPFKSERSFEMDALLVATSRRCVARISSFYFGAIFLFLIRFSLSFCLLTAVFIPKENCRNANISPLFGEVFDFINKSFFCWIYFWKDYILPYYFELK